MLRQDPACEIDPELAVFAGETTPKRRFSRFNATVLEERLTQSAPNELLVVGVCTRICVMHTVADAGNRGYQVEVPRVCVATFDPEAHEFAPKHTKQVLAAKVI